MPSILIAFLNADVIAAGISPFAPEEAAIAAGRIMHAEIDRRVRLRQSFAFETTLSSRGFARMIPEWRHVGYRVTLIFVRLNSVEMSILRVADRVRPGGHSIPELVIRRRFPLGLWNFEHLYRDLLDDWLLYDNSGNAPVVVATGELS
ncbi:MAG: zeta toxin family protein [Chloroflexota bacterium]